MTAPSSSRCHVPTLRRAELLAALALALAALGPTAASAATTHYVDDDKANCQWAKHTAIEPAIEAAAAGDTIQVCKGTYRGGPLFLPPTKPGLILRAHRPSYRETILLPPNEPGAHPEYWPSYRVGIWALSPGGQIRGFKFASDPGCTGGSATAIWTLTRVKISENTFHSDPDCAGGYGAAVLGSPGTENSPSELWLDLGGDDPNDGTTQFGYPITITGNTFRGWVTWKVIHSWASPLVIANNNFHSSRLRRGVAIGVSEAGSVEATSNLIANYDQAVQLSGSFLDSAVTLHRNRLVNNAIGLAVDFGGVEATANTFARNGIAMATLSTDEWGFDVWEPFRLPNNTYIGNGA